MLNLSRIRAITLDLDDTLWPIWPCIERAEKVLHHWLLEQAPATAALYADPHVRRVLREATEQEFAAQAHDLSLLRRESIRRALRQAGDDPGLAEPAFDLFFAERMRVDLFDDVHSTLDWLARRWPLYVVSNGNADVHQVGIGRYFAGSVNARQVGVAKPDPKIFHAAARALQLAPEDILHVGDDAALDVLGALGVGMQAVWVNRSEHLWSYETPHPHATVASMSELRDLLTV